MGRGWVAGWVAGGPGARPAARSRSAKSGWVAGAGTTTTTTNNNNNNKQQSFYPNAQCSHQCQGFHATPANTPTLWGGSASSTKYPNDSSRPPTPSFPPYDVGTLHFVACGRPWLLHWRMGTTTTTLYIIHVVYETYDTHERDTTVGHIFGARAGGFSDFLYEKVVRFHMFY